MSRCFRFSFARLVASPLSIAIKRKPFPAFVTLLAALTYGTAFADGPPTCQPDDFGPSPNCQHRVQQKVANPGQPNGIFLGTTGWNPTFGCGAGTLGSLVRMGETTYILSNNHVLAGVNRGDKGQDPIVHVAPLDTLPEECEVYPPGQLTVATLTDFVPLIPLPPKAVGAVAANLMDAAVAQVSLNDCPGNGPCVRNDGSILDLGNIPTTTTDTGGPVSATTAPPSMGLKVQKSGRTTGLTMGSITGLKMTLTVNYRNQRPGFFARFVNQFMVGKATSPPCKNGDPCISAEGDSGSLVVDMSSPPHPVGLLFAGPTNPPFSFCIASPIDVVLNTFSVRLGGKITFVSQDDQEAPERQMATGEESELNQRVEAAIQVKDRHDDYLMQLPEVVGNGVTLSDTGSGEVVIRVFLREATEEALGSVPTELEGIRVETEVTGEFTAY